MIANLAKSSVFEAIIIVIIPSEYHSTKVNPILPSIIPLPVSIQHLGLAFIVNVEGEVVISRGGLCL